MKQQDTTPAVGELMNLQEHQQEGNNENEDDEMLLDDLTPFHDPISCFPKNNERELQNIQQNKEIIEKSED